MMKKINKKWKKIGFASAEKFCHLGERISFVFET